MMINELEVRGDVYMQKNDQFALFYACYIYFTTFVELCVLND